MAREDARRMEGVLAILVGSLLLAGPAAFAALLVGRVPTPAAAFLCVMMWGLGPRIAHPESPRTFDPRVFDWVLLEQNPRWRGILGGSCQASGFLATLWLVGRTGRRWRRGGLEEAPPGEPPTGQLTCARCGTAAPEPATRCPECGEELWRGQD